MRGVEEEPWEGYLVRPYNIFLFVRVCIKNVTENPIPILVQNATASVGLSNAASGLAGSGPYPNFCRAELEHPRNECGGSPRTLPAVTMLSQKDGGRDVTPWALRRVESTSYVKGELLSVCKLVATCGPGETSAASSRDLVREGSRARRRRIQT